MAGYQASYSDGNSSQLVTGNNFGGVNLGAVANKHETPDFIASRLTGKPQAITLSDNPLAIVLVVSGLAIITALVIRRMK